MKFDFEKPKVLFKKAIAGLLVFVLIAGQSGITSNADGVVDENGSYNEGDISGSVISSKKQEKKLCQEIVVVHSKYLEMILC